MKTHRRIAREVEAVRWFKNGDHPAVGPFRPGKPGIERCLGCGHLMHGHGRIDQPDDELVCPGDWVVTGDHGTYHLYNNTDFLHDHEPIE